METIQMCTTWLMKPRRLNGRIEKICGFLDVFCSRVHLSIILAVHQPRSLSAICEAAAVYYFGCFELDFSYYIRANQQTSLCYSIESDDRIIICSSKLDRAALHFIKANGTEILSTHSQIQWNHHAITMNRLISIVVCRWSPVSFGFVLWIQRIAHHRQIINNDHPLCSNSFQHSLRSSTDFHGSLFNVIDLWNL